MPLSAIINRLAATSGIVTNIASQRNYLLGNLINPAAGELHANYELRNGNREQIFNIGADQQQITLPWFVDRVLAARDYDSRVPINQLDMRTRYQSNDWLGYNYNSFRTKQREYPLSREISNAALLTLTFPTACPVATTVTITGKTLNASRTTEIVNFAAGDTTHDTVNSYEEVESINKPATAYDLTVTDIDVNEVAFVPNFSTKSKYVMLQVMDRWQSFSPARLCEILFRPIFRPFSLDTDVFVCGDLYDDAIYWKCLEYHYATRSDAESLQLALASNAKCADSIERIARQEDDGKIMKLNTGSNAVYMAMDGIQRPYSSFGNQDSSQYPMI